MEDPRRKRGRGAGKAPERSWRRREGGPFMPQARRASLLGRRAEVHHEINWSLRRSGGQRGSVVVVMPAASVSEQAKPGSVPARHAVQCRAKQPVGSAVIAAAADGVRLPLLFHEIPPEGRFFVPAGHL
jgi:hypothetical protein